MLAGGETRQGECEDIAARSTFGVHRSCSDDECMGGIQTAGDANDDLRIVQCPQSLSQPGNLDVVTLVTVLFQPRRVTGNERETLDLTSQTDISARRSEPEPNAAERFQLCLVMATVVVECSHPQPLGTKQIQVDIGDTAAIACGEPLGLREQPTVLVDHRLPVPGQIGARLAFPGSGVDIGRQAACRRRTGEHLAVFSSTDGDRAAGQVGQDRRPGECGLRTRRNRDEHVLADLDVQHEAGDIDGVEQQIGSERNLHVQSGQPDHPAHIVTGRDLTALIELPVGR